jgi:hypothetical protein
MNVAIDVDVIAMDFEQVASEYAIVVAVVGDCYLAIRLLQPKQAWRAAMKEIQKAAAAIPLLNRILPAADRLHTLDKRSMLDWLRSTESGDY